MKTFLQLSGILTLVLAGGAVEHNHLILGGVLILLAVGQAVVSLSLRVDTSNKPLTYNQED